MKIIKNNKPVVIEFVGMPRAGKSTQIRLLGEALKAKGLRVKVLSDRRRASKIKTPCEERIAFELVFFTLALEEYFSCRDHYDVIIIDRGFYDSIVWFEITKNQIPITAQRIQELKKTFLEYTSLVDRLVCMMVKPDETARRHVKTKHMKVDDIGIDMKTLKLLEKAYNLRRNSFKDALFLSGYDSRSVIHGKIMDYVAGVI